jgi:hypothetical protein
MGRRRGGGKQAVVQGEDEQEVGEEEKAVRGGGSEYLGKVVVMVEEVGRVARSAGTSCDRAEVELVRFASGGVMLDVAIVGALSERGVPCARSSRSPCRLGTRTLARASRWAGFVAAGSVTGTGGQDRHPSLLCGRGACQGPRRSSTQSSKPLARMPATRSPATQGVPRSTVTAGLRITCRGEFARRPALACPRARRRRGVCLPSAACSAPAEAACKPLAALGLGLTAALRVHSAPPLAPGAALSDTRPAPTGARRTR